MPRRHGIALFFVSAALVSTLLLQRFFAYPFLFLFFAAVMSSAWFGGTAPGLFAVLLSTLVVDYFFIPPVYSFAVKGTEVTYFAAFVLCSLAASWVSSSKKKGEDALKEARDKLEARVGERTAELQRSNSELRENERRLRLLTEVIPQQIWSATPDGSIDYCNQRLLDYAGRTTKEMQGENFLETIHPEDRDSFHQSWQDALSSGKVFEGEWRVRAAGGGYRLFFTRGVPLQDAAGKTIRWYGTNTDIEERQKAEQALMRSQEELAHLSRALTMGELTASIAHEVDQPLTAVVTYGHACLEWLSANPPNLIEGRRAAGTVIQEGSRAAAILGRIRALFKKEPPAKDWLDMNEVIRELTVFLRDAAMRHRISLRTELTPHLPRIKGDRVQLQQVVVNLVMNAIDATGQSNGRPKEILIGTREENSGEVLIQVEDRGIGLTAEMAEKIFDPFFTTKPHGLGMGLSISRSIVESHEGRMWAVPRPPGGAVFKFTLPAGLKEHDA